MTAIMVANMCGGNIGLGLAPAAVPVLDPLHDTEPCN